MPDVIVSAQESAAPCSLAQQFLLSSTLTALFGGLAVEMFLARNRGRTVTKEQPVKLAAFEGLVKTTKGAPFTIGGVFDEDEQRVRWGIEIPHLLSLLAKHDPNATITGLDSVPPEDRPPVNVVRLSFQTMVGIGTGLALLGTVFFVTWLRRRRLPRSPWFFRAVIAAGPLSLVALIAGWITTEVGRQPWIVYEVMRTEQAVTQADGLEVGYVVLVSVYIALAVAVAWLLRRLTRKPEVVDG